MALSLEFDPARLPTVDGYSWANVSATISYPTYSSDTWTLTAGITDPYAALQDLIAWGQDGARPWDGEPFAVRWTRYLSGVTGETGTAAWEPVEWSIDSAPDDTYSLLFSGDGTAATTVWPSTGWDVRVWRRRGYKGQAAAYGATRGGVVGLGDLQATATGILTRDEVDSLQALLYAATSPRRGHILQESTGPSDTPGAWGTWRAVSIGEVTLERAGPTLWRVSLELGGDPL